MLEMRREDVEMVVVVDEYGGAVGILTFEDIIEEIVGEISDEYDTESLPYKELSERSWLVQARMEIGDLNERLRLQLPEGDYETLSGFLLQQFGRIPRLRTSFFSTPRPALTNSPFAKPRNAISRSCSWNAYRRDELGELSRSRICRLECR